MAKIKKKVHICKQMNIVALLSMNFYFFRDLTHNYMKI